MKTIEERAKECSYKIYTSGVEWWCDSNSMIEFGKLCYKKGAKEQRKIDIDKACKWLKARNVLTDASLEGFRQVMED